ncbi:SDR family NAD(P)-dependent oxidoreductase [Mesorhizobium retamae]|uniref:Glucose 1-dehydrogenase n=1 Tax=Mesorhizobium retamae TaxID=2912854 RepID=A0ABS9QH20_9HYPH|nr:glucose 1-dehydrogenase [Mesorhizobium sp. IRAMC:0171]MCG7506738.1 glucose 1-dehydrogenase [Mesorhizobium sp. IRAMC:0171]
MSAEVSNVSAEREAGRMEGLVCLVTGGGSGIGRATALRMAEAGAAAVIVAGRRDEEGEAVAQACRAAGADAVFLRTDVTREEDVEQLVRTIVARFGRLDAAFNNAGYQEHPAPLEQQPSNVFDAVFDTNVRSVFLSLKHQLAVMLAQQSGRIVINASVSGIRNPNPGFALYSASKAAAISLMRSAAMAYAPYGVRINAVAPGRVVTDMMMKAAAGVGGMEAVAAGLPLRRMGQPEEVAEAVVWLASDRSAYIVGHVLAADGGFLAS